MNEDARQRILVVVHEHLGWNFDEDSLAQWRIRSDALAEALLDHPIFTSDRDTYFDLGGVVAALVEKGIVAGYVGDLVSQLDEASENSEYGSYADSTLSDANEYREDLAQALEDCFAPNNEQDVHQ